MLNERAEPVATADRAGIPAFRSILAFRPARLLSLVVRRQLAQLVRPAVAVI